MLCDIEHHRRIYARDTRWLPAGWFIQAPIQTADSGPETTTCRRAWQILIAPVIRLSPLVAALFFV
jgi:hypothetical protein